MKTEDWEKIIKIGLTVITEVAQVILIIVASKDE